MFGINFSWKGLSVLREGLNRWDEQVKRNTLDRILFRSNIFYLMQVVQRGASFFPFTAIYEMIKGN